MMSKTFLLHFRFNSQNFVPTVLDKFDTENKANNSVILTRNSLKQLLSTKNSKPGTKVIQCDNI